MSDDLLLPAVGLCVASMCTVLGARRIERAEWALPPPLWFLAVSLATPMAWLALQTLILTIIIFPVSDLHANFVEKWPSYLRDVVFLIGIKLWICGGVCAAGLAFIRRCFSNGPSRDDRAQHGLWLAGGGLAAAIILAMTMQYWIQNGRLSLPFELFTLGCAFATGLLPATALSFGLLRMGGARAHMRYAEPVAALYAGIIVCCGYAWHLAVITRPGAIAVIVVEISAVGGVFVAWLAVRHGNRAAAAVFE